MSDVLIVDDSLTVRMSLAEAMLDAGFSVVACATIAEARDALSKETFGLAILDVLLPDGDGIELLGEIRGNPDTRATTVMLLSTEAEIRNRVRGLMEGADEYVGKPYDLAHVLARARELLRRGQGAAETVREMILVIDDSLTFREQLKEELVGAGYDVLTASSGEEGLRIVADTRPDVVIVDGVLPGIDGATVVRRIRMDVALRRIPCILLTGSEERGAEIQALDAGADTFIRKNEDIAVLLARLSAVLRSVDGPQAGEHDGVSLFAPKKILAVDDSETFLQRLGAEFRTDGYDVIATRSGEEALELLAAQPVDCILLDLAMSGMDGREACRRIKATQGIRSIPVVVLTAIETGGALIESLDAGADDYIVKSDDFQILRARVLAQIRRKQFEDENRLIREQLLQKEMEAIEARAAREVGEMQAVLAERRRSEEQMSRLQAELTHVSRWNAMGMMASTLAHELNQPLTAARTYLEMAGKATEGVKGPRVRRADEMTAKAAEQISQAGAIISSLREFIEKRETTRRREDLNKVVQEAIALGLIEGRHLDLKVCVQLQPGLPPVFANKIQIQQVLVNLFRNSIEAMQGVERRELTIATSDQGAGFVAVTVSDTGPGIPPHVRARLFEPFTTTKQEGMGIGLKICQSIIEAHEGRIWVSSNDGAGATFHFSMPVFDETLVD